MEALYRNWPVYETLKFTKQIKNPGKVFQKSKFKQIAVNTTEESHTIGLLSIQVDNCYRQTDREVKNSFTQFTGVCGFFFPLNLLPPYLLRLQGSVPWTDRGLIPGKGQFFQNKNEKNDEGE